MDRITETSQIRVSSNVMFWIGAKPITGTVVGFADGGFVVETDDDVVFVPEADCKAAGDAPKGTSQS